MSVPHQNYIPVPGGPDNRIEKADLQGLPTQRLDRTFRAPMFHPSHRTT
jgi:hypothetical protein